MVVGYHLIWTAYGWWLANDPRGSGSIEIRVETLEKLGELHKGRKKVQPPGSEVTEFYREAQDLLKHPLLTFSQKDLATIAAAFKKVIEENGYVCHACAIMPDHVHMLVRRHLHYAEAMIEKLQTASRNAVIAAGMRSITHPVWGGKGWKVFLITRKDFERTEGYIWQNPIKINWPAQEWEFVKKYDGWMP